MLPSAGVAHRWVLLAGIALAALDLRIAVTSIAPLLGRVGADVGLTSVDTSLLAAAPPLLFSLCGMVTTVVARRIGLEWTLLASLALAGVGTLGRSLAGHPAAFLVWTAVAMAGLGIGNILIAPLIKRYFPHRIGLVTTVYTVFLVIGQALPPVFILGLADAIGWRLAVGLGAAMAVLAAVLWLIAKPWWVKPVPKADGARGRGRIRIGQLAHSPVAWGIAAMLAGNSMAGYCLMAWLPQILIDEGAGAGLAAAALAVFTVGSLFGALVLPPLMVRLRRTGFITVAMPLIWVAGLVGLIVSPLWGTFVWIGITRVGDGSFAAAMTLMNLRSRRPEMVVALSGVTQAASYLASAAVSFVFGLLHATTGGWTASLVLLTCLIGVVGVVGALLTARPRYVEDTLGMVE